MSATDLLHKVTGPAHHAWPRADEVLRAATSGGARTARRHREIGTVAPGMQADLLVYDLSTLAFTPRNRAELQLVHSENGSSLRRVPVAGNSVVEDGRLTTVDEDALRAEFADLMPGIRAEQDRLERENDVSAAAFEWMHRACAGEDVGVHRWSGPDPSLARSRCAAAPLGHWVTGSLGHWAVPLPPDRSRPGPFTPVGAPGRRRRTR